MQPALAADTILNLEGKNTSVFKAIFLKKKKVSKLASEEQF